MHRNDNSNYFLYIEPSIEEKSLDPIDDIYVDTVEFFFERAQPGTIYGYSNLEDPGERADFMVGGGWRGRHENCDGELSSNCDYLLENGYITNSLCVHYVRWFRKSITGPNLEKLERLVQLFIESQPAISISRG